MIELNNEVSRFLDELNHPLRHVIEQLRTIILQSNPDLTENIKWNGPNYCYHDEDRLTMRIQPPKQIQLIFHRGAKKRTQPEHKLIQDNSGLLTWKENDRALLSFKQVDDLKKVESHVSALINDWLSASA
ncbi:DUF1801 domain-containing protein [bacterium]|nr:MAG: DUF1801 domain-containing protein [bacterium]